MYSFFRLKTATPLFFISFFLAFNYYILKALKDTVLITAEGSGAEAIPFVKVWLLLPISVLLAMGFAWITARYTLRTTFTIVLGFFLLAYFSFSFLLFPFRESIHLHSFADMLQTILPSGWKGFTAVIRYWSYTFFYAMAECWGTMVYSVLFWGFANEVTKLREAEWSYPILTLAGTIAALVAGPLAVHLSLNTYNPLFPLGNTPWEQSLYALTFLILGCGIATLIVLYCFFPKEILLSHALQKKSTPPISLKESFAYLVQSKHLLSIALVAFSFNMMINLSEVFWKDQVVKLYSSPSAFNAYMSSVTTITGIVSTLITFVICGPCLRKYGWTVTAMITPCIALVTGTPFFAAMLFSQDGSVQGGPFLQLPLIVLLGSIHICLSYSAKYTLLDTAKELAFIPLESDLRLQGKAVIDGVGSRMGKASSSIILQCLLMTLPSIGACTSYICIIVFLTISICVFSVQVLGKKLQMIESKEVLST